MIISTQTLELKVPPHVVAVLMAGAMWGIGIEDIAFDDEGRLWSVSEAGSLRWQKWSKTFPVLFRTDLNKLKQNR